MRARRGAACGRVVVFDLSDSSVGSPNDSSTIPHVTSRGRRRIPRAFVAAAQVLAGAVLKVGNATDARPQVEELGRAFWAAAGVAVDIPVDSSTNPLVALCGWRVLHIFAAAAQAVVGATPEAGRATSRSYTEELARAAAYAVAAGVPEAQRSY